MKRWVLLFAAFLCFSAVASAQEEATRRSSFSAGIPTYHFDAPGTLASSDPPILANLNGGSGSVAVNPISIWAWWRILGDTQQAKTASWAAPLYTYLFGPKIAFRSGRFTPFAQVLVGGAHFDISGGSSTAGAWAGGVGLDVNLTATLAFVCSKSSICGPISMTASRPSEQHPRFGWRGLALLEFRRDLLLLLQRFPPRPAAKPPALFYSR